VTATDVATGREKWTSQLMSFDFTRYAPTSGFNVTSLMPLADGKRLLAWGKQTQWEILAAATGKVLHADFDLKENRSVLLIDNEMLFCKASGPSVLLRCDTRIGSKLKTISEPLGQAQCLGLSSDGRSLATVLPSRGVQLWEIATGQKRETLLGPDSQVERMCVSPDRKRLAVSCNNMALVLDLTGASGRESKPSRAPKVLWLELASEDGARAYQAVWDLATHDKCTAYLREQLRPVPRLTPEELNRLLEDLDGRRFATRERAMRELERQGEFVRGPLLKRLQDRPTLEVSRRIEMLLRCLEQGELSKGNLPTVRAIEALENLGTPQARELLRTLASGLEGARCTEEARAAVRRLETSSQGP
jgi:hypothetical protein